MPPSKKGRSVWRVLVAVAVAIATVVTMILVGNQMALADVWWGSGRFGPEVATHRCRAGDDGRGRRKRDSARRFVRYQCPG